MCSINKLDCKRQRSQFKHLNVAVNCDGSVGNQRKR